MSDKKHSIRNDHHSRVAFSTIKGIISNSVQSASCGQQGEEANGFQTLLFLSQIPFVFRAIASYVSFPKTNKALQFASVTPPILLGRTLASDVSKTGAFEAIVLRG